MAGQRRPIPISQLQKYSVNRAGMVNAFTQPLYDFQAYAAGGQTSLVFFQLPIGQASKTYADTNMTNPGALPNPVRQIVQSIQIMFFPGSAVNATGAIGTNGLNWQDVWTVWKSGWLEFLVGSSTLLYDAPLGKFPCSQRLAGAAALADATTAGAGLHSQIDYATFAGPVKQITPVLLEPTQNFSVTLRWPTAVALPSTVAGRIGVILEGEQYKLSQ